jgi:hypothetical protein
MHIKTCIALGLVVALAACGKSGQHNGATGGGSSAVQMQPGEWELTFETVNVTGTGLPPAYAAAMKAHKITKRDCLTPEEAANPMGKIVEAQKNGQCDYSGFSIANGRIQGTITCGGGPGKAPGKMTMTMNGQYDGQNYAYTSSMTSAGQGMNMTIDSRSVAHRVGDCPAGSADNAQ